MASLPIAIFNFEGEVQESNLRLLLEMVLRLSAALSSLKAVAGYDSRFTITLVTQLIIDKLFFFVIIIHYV